MPRAVVKRGKKKVNSRQKGKVGERKARIYLTKIGFDDAKRTAQCNGQLEESESDVICRGSLPDVHIEVKYLVTGMTLGSSLLNAAVKQSEDECKHRAPCVLWRMRGCQQWLLSLPGGLTYHEDEAIAKCLKDLQLSAKR